MANQVFANSREVSCKAGQGKAVCAFPDVCFTPPAPPTGLPVPYPNTGVDTDSSNGSRSVKISKKEVMLKNKSYFKKSVGDEAGRAPKKGVLTTVNGGKVYFNAWSMDVKFEGENVVRHMDLTTHNHASPPGNTPTWPFLSGAAVADPNACDPEKEKLKNDCEGVENPCAGCRSTKKPSGKKTSKGASNLADRTAANKCLAAQRCILLPYNPNKCCKPQTGHHLVEASALHDKGRGGKDSTPVKGVKGYKEGAAPVVCAEGVNQHTGTHGLMHTLQSAEASKAAVGKIELSQGDPIYAKATTYGQARDSGIKAFQKVFPQSQCSDKCLQAQLDSYHRRCGLQDNTPVKAVETGQVDVTAAEREIAARTARVQSSNTSGQGGAY